MGSGWMESLKQANFSARSAAYMVNMTRIVLEDKYAVSSPEHGRVRLTEYIDKMVNP
jgi:hypothetical protein